MPDSLGDFFVFIIGGLSLIHISFGVVLHLGLLLLVKYTPFFATNLNHLFQLLGLSLTVNIPSFAMPIGISFYTLQAVSYCFDAVSYTHLGAL